METKHTNGNWIIQDLPAHNRYGIYSEDKDFLGVFFYQDNKAETEANAKLICAAPKLLQTAILCESITDRCNNAMLPKHIQELLKSLNESLNQAINQAINQ